MKKEKSDEFVVAMQKKKNDIDIWKGSNFSLMQVQVKSEVFIVCLKMSGIVVKFAFFARTLKLIVFLYICILTLIGMRQGGFNFWIGFCQLNFYKKFLNIFGGENWDKSG